MRLVTALLMLLSLSCSACFGSVYVPGQDITAQLAADIAAGANGASRSSAIITLPAGTFYLSAQVNLMGTTIHGAGKLQTTIVFSKDLGSGVAGITGNLTNTGQSFEIDDCTIQGPRPVSTVPCGTSPNGMDGIRLLDGCILRRVAVNYFHAGIICDGNHHVLDELTSQCNYYGCMWPSVSYDGTYFDDDIKGGSSISANKFADLYVAPGGQLGGASFDRTHCGFSPFGLYLDKAASAGGCQFLQVQFEGCGNQIICGADANTNITTSHFEECSFFGQYNNDIPTLPRSPQVTIGYFLSNSIFAPNTQGPLPGNMTCLGGCYSNNWFSDALTLSAIQTGSITPIQSPATCTYNNALQAGDIYADLLPVYAAVLFGQPVASANQRSVEVEPAGSSGFLGVALQPAVAGQAAWIAQRGNIDVLTSAPVNPGIPLNGPQGSYVLTHLNL
ncbi:MAG: hypothetical protein ACLQVD_01485 [Capsulimonadaceae bacterium]